MEEIYDHQITLWANDERAIGTFDSKGVLPNTGDIIEVGFEKYEVLKRRIDYVPTPPLVSLYVSYYDA